MSFIGIKDFNLEIAKGNIPGHSTVNKFGSNVSVTANTEEDIWDLGGDYPYPTTADITHIHQITNNAADLGMMLEISGLDANWDLVTQTKALDLTDTTTLVALDTAMIRIHRVKVIDNITSSDSVQVCNSGDTIQYAQITNGNNQTLMALYTIPNGYTGYLERYYASNINSTGKTAKSVEVKLWFADRFADYEFQLKDADGIAKEGAPIDNRYDLPLKVTQKTDIRISAEPLDEDGHVHARFELILVANS